MTCWKVTTRIVVVAMAVCLLCCTVAQAKKPDKPPGGGEGDETTAFSVIELPDVKVAFAVSNADADGLVTVVGRNEGDAAYALVDVDTRQVVASGLLPEPGDVNSTARDANVASLTTAPPIGVQTERQSST